MKAIVGALALALGTLPAAVAAQDSRNPVADALRTMQQRLGKNLTDAADEMPADKYGYKPTPAQMSFGDVVVHLAEGNDYLCSTVGGVTAPQRAKVAATDTKDKLVARLRETFDFCGSALAKASDAALGDSVPFFGGRKVTKATAVLVTVGDWEDHYSQVAIYLRLNGLLPPTARRGAQ
ncbi:MAG TPA: DinB family protein [Gemmatimonadales bacterium]|nr:DinB family protein [Gemmatimonadales bacterium]